MKIKLITFYNLTINNPYVHGLQYLIFTHLLNCK